MLLSTILLTACVCVSGCNHSALANTIEAIKEEADNALLQASEFDYSAFDLTFEEQDELAKQTLYEFIVDNDLLLNLVEEITEDDSTISSELIDSINKDDLALADTILSGLTNETSVAQAIANGDDILSNTSTSSSLTETTPSNISTGHEVANNGGSSSQVISSGSSNDSSSGSNSSSNGNFSYENNTGTGTSSNKSTDTSTDDDDETLPIKSYDESNVTTSSSRNVFGDCIFLGIVATKDACISAYNIFAGWANNQLTYTASGSGSPLKIAIEALKLVSATAATTAVGAALTTAITSAIAAVSSYLGSIWAGYVAILLSGGIVGAIVAAIIALMALACITAIASMIVFGWLGKGYAIGWKVYHIFKWKWYNGILN